MTVSGRISRRRKWKARSAAADACSSLDSVNGSITLKRES